MVKMKPMCPHTSNPNDYVRKCLESRDLINSLTCLRLTA